MCKYCEFVKRNAVFSSDEIIRGELFTNDCDIEAYIVEEKYNDGFKDYSIAFESYNGYETWCELNYCPMCGRKLK